MSIFIVTCGPSAVGKTYQMQKLINRDRRRFTPVLSVTTRQRRGPEDGEWYKFVTRESLADLDPKDVISDVEYRGEHYILLRSEIDKALERAPIAFMAIVPSVISILRQQDIKHVLINCKISDQAAYARRLKARGFKDAEIAKEIADGIGFEYPAADPVWPMADVELGSDTSDDEKFIAVVASLSGNLFPKVLR
jgi:guanylate kinase